MSSPTSRLLLLLSLLQARQDWPGGLLADRLAVSPRTLRRDIDRLRQMGYRVGALMGPAGGYRLEPGSELPPLLFDDDQAVALALSLQAATVSGVEMGEAAARALATVRQVMPARLRRRIDAIAITPIPGAGGAPKPGVDAAVLLAVSTACRNRERLRFDYASDMPGDGSPSRTVEPHHVVTWSGRWYLAAWDLDREAWRTFRVDRITPRPPTRQRFTPRDLPGGDVAAFVAARFKGATGSEGWPCLGGVTLSLPAREVAPFVEDGLVEDLGQDRCRLILGSWSWVALAASVGRFDAEIEAVSPAELVAAFSELANRYAAAAADPAGAP